ncbi:MAG: hypothetical protein M3O46_09245 [Myxococcota bacterium]|nr:hypothetical protein [Myxococcota bacterium]
MRIAVMMMGSALVAACGAGGHDAPPAESPAPAAAPSSSADDPNRRLTKSECESLAETIVDACNNRGNDRSSEADGWCSDMVRNNTADRPWIVNDCLPHFRYMDYFCFRSGNAHAMMVCDRTVDRTR